MRVPAFICVLNFCGWSQSQNFFNCEIFPIYGVNEKWWPTPRVYNNRSVHLPYGFHTRRMTYAISSEYCKL